MRAHHRATLDLAAPQALVGLGRVGRARSARRARGSGRRGRARSPRSARSRCPSRSSRLRSSYGCEKNESGNVPPASPTSARSPSGRAGRRAERERVVAADEVEHELGPPAVGRLAHLRGGVVAGRARVTVGADLASRARACPARGRRRSIRAGASALQDLDRHVAEPAGADHDRVRAGHELVQRALDRVVRRERRVGQRRRVARVELAERHSSRAAGHEQVLGHPAVATEAAAHRADLGRALAVVLAPSAGSARSARSPTARRRRPARRARTPSTPAPRLLDPAGVLVAERERRVERQQPGGPLHQVQVGVAGAGTAVVGVQTSSPQNPIVGYVTNPAGQASSSATITLFDGSNQR